VNHNRLRSDRLDKIPQPVYDYAGIE